LAGATDVPVQYFQSIITIELAVTGALLWQMRYFDRDTTRTNEHPPDARLRLGLALVLGGTLFGSLWAMADDGPEWAATAVTIGLAISVIPILVRGLPPLTGDPDTKARDPDAWITVVALVGYVAIVGLTLIMLDSPSPAAD
jgi:peptidoglycan/LPS O-acetylase OafA/YrhL